MWPFIFILAMVPLVFFWSDSVLTMFPQLAPYLPAKSASAGAAVDPTASAPAVEGVNTWVESTTDQGFVAWTVSQDGSYRLIVGCQPQQAATLQVAALTGEPIEAPLSVNYSYGTLSLTSGFYTGNELLGAVSQFKDIYLQRTGEDPVLAQFHVDSLRSGAIARTLQSSCAN